jgi:quercetin dioxygenase-like cupin family protein
VPLALALAAVLAAGVALGVTGDRLLVGESEDEPAVRGEGMLDELPDAPVTVRAETVLLPAGFRSRHLHGGPTFNSVESGTVEIEDERGTSVYGPGEFFFEPGGRPHEIRVVADVRLDVVRLLPPGARATTELP